MSAMALSLPEIKAEDRSRVGGKGFALAVMARGGLRVPPALCIPPEAYLEFVAATGIRETILLELGRKSFEDMRWEEIWDTSLRIRNSFLQAPIPETLREKLIPPLEGMFSGKSVAVRSSAPGEDSAKTSFAGLHESYIHVRGIESILEHIRLVWASLWSDRALLYRKELGLDVEKSTMSVVVQEMVSGERSGVAFGKNPLDPSQAVIEAVYGLNQAMVDGTVEPDRWILRQDTGEVISHHVAKREKKLAYTPAGVRLEPLSLEIGGKPPLEPSEIGEVFGLTRKAETLFGSPQDVEWTYMENFLFTLQSRPITAKTSDSGDTRRWYLSLHRSFENLKNLRRKIEDELLPQMEKEAGEMARIGLAGLTDADLAGEIERRLEIGGKWDDRYKEFCIPFAHGMRLFGQVYNDKLKPENPFEFMDLLGVADMISVQRNRVLENLVRRVRRNPRLAESLRRGRREGMDPGFLKALESFLAEFGDQGWSGARLGKDPRALFTLLRNMALRGSSRRGSAKKNQKSLEKKFFSRFEEDRKGFAAELLDLGRASYRLRDDDNIYMGKIQAQIVAAAEEGKRRLRRRGRFSPSQVEAPEVARALRDARFSFKKIASSAKKSKKEEGGIRGRQLVGQPASQGIAMGKARVILRAEDLFGFQPGEILVCDAIEPNMTFVVPLAAGIVERRGGMLIHGAIIAREYGIPCVTGIPDAISLIPSGTPVTVDGFLGIVIIGETTLPGKEKMQPQSPQRTQRLKKNSGEPHGSKGLVKQ
jgi:phosphohistidine swiveling domain-containing protein